MTAGKDKDAVETAGEVVKGGDSGHHGHAVEADGAAAEAAGGGHHWLVTRNFERGSLGALGHVCGCEIGADHLADGEPL